MMWPARALREAGVVGMNARNGDFVAKYNPRRLYPLVDDKLRTKALAIEAGVAVPELYGVIASEHEAEDLEALLKPRKNFVIKPAHGAGGDGIIVVRGRRGGNYLRASGTPLAPEALRHHVSNILSGLYSLGGMPDRAMLEYCVNFDPVFSPITYQGVPDIRTLVFRGVPVCAMVRLPTRESDGKANLHQGAVGVGIDLKTGLTLQGVHHTQMVRLHPDTGAPLKDFRIPHWERVLELAAHCFDLAPLGYLGVDIVLDRDRGPLVLELNARPGLAIQLANGHGLQAQLRKIEAIEHIPASAIERVALSVPGFSGAPEAPKPQHHEDLDQEYFF